MYEVRWPFLENNYRHCLVQWWAVPGLAELPLPSIPGTGNISTWCYHFYPKYFGGFFARYSKVSLWPVSILSLMSCIWWYWVIYSEDVYHPAASALYLLESVEGCYVPSASDATVNVFLWLFSRLYCPVSARAVKFVQCRAAIPLYVLYLLVFIIKRVMRILVLPFYV